MTSRIEKTRYGIIALICIAIAGYSLYEARNIIRGPIISIQAPESGVTTKQAIVEVRGNVKNARSITLNDRPITINEIGVFEEEFALAVGYNIAKIAVEDRFGRRKEKFIEIIREESPDGLVIR